MIRFLDQKDKSQDLTTAVGGVTVNGRPSSSILLFIYHVKLFVLQRCDEFC